MTASPDASGLHPRRHRISLGLAVILTLPGLAMRLGAFSSGHGVEAVVFGLAIVGAAFLLSWAAEVAQLDISAGLAIAVLAFIAVLPEYAVDLVFAWKGGNAVQEHGPACQALGSTTESPCSLALANMTGANRLLIGIGWSLVVFVAWYQWRRRSKAAAISAAAPGAGPAGASEASVAAPAVGTTQTAGALQRLKGDGSSGGPGRPYTITLERSHSVEVAFLAVACLYSLTLPLKRTVTLVDAAVLVALFAAYTVRISRAPAEEPHLVGPASYIGTFDVPRRRAAVALMFLFAAGVILMCAEHFAEALVATGAEFGISEFLLVQWLAPLASEAPELLVAGLYAWRLNTDAGLGTLVSSKVNQWTLLVGTLPIVFAIASGSLSGLPIMSQQREELLLTAAQSVFAVAILSDLSISVREAGALFGLFWAQFVIGAIVPESAHGVELVIVSIVYMVLGIGILVKNRRRLGRLLRDGLRTSYASLGVSA